MQVMHHLTGVRSLVRQKSKAGAANPFAARELSAHLEEFPKQWRVLGLKIGNAREMNLRNNEEVDTILRPDIPKAKDLGILIYNIRGYLTRSNLAEETVTHVPARIRGRGHPSCRSRFFKMGPSASRFKSIVSCTPLSMLRRIIV